MSDIKIDLMPYLSFNGECEEAMNFYKGILGAKLEIVSRYDNPAMNAPDDYKNKILHARLNFDAYVIFASDVMPNNPIREFHSNIALSLAIKNEEDAVRVFDRLSEGGKIHIPFKKQFWGDWHGNFTDRFGIRWMVNCTK